MQHLKGCSPARRWGKIKTLSGMEGPVGSRDNVLKSIHHLEGACGLSADNLANHINTAFVPPMEDFEPLTHNPFRGDVSVSSSRTVNELSVLKKLCAVNPAKAQGPNSIPGWLLKENEDLLTPPPPIMDIMNISSAKAGCPYLGKEQISSLSPNKDLSKTSTSTFAPFPLRLSCPRLQRIMLFMTGYNIPNHILCLIADFLLDRRQRVKLAQDCFSECHYRTVHPSRCSSGDKARAVALLNND